MWNFWALPLSFAVVLAATIGACAQAYPSQAVRVVVPFSPGSISDNLARIVAIKLKDMWKQDVIVENRPGPPGTTSVAKSAPDGYTLMLTSNGHTVATVVSKGIQFDPVKDFAGVTQIASVPLVMIFPPDFSANSIKEFIVLAKQKPGQLNFSSAGIASTSFLASEIFRQAANISLTHVPYKGSPEAMTALMRGDVQMALAIIPSARDFRAGGKAKIIAINSARRVEELADVPTIAESGVPDYRYDSWFGMMAPAGTPKPILTKVSQDIEKVLQMPDVRELLVVQGSIPLSNSPDEFDAIIRNDTERNVKILRAAGVGGD